MAVTLAEINKLRQKTQAGLMDCKKALTEANGDMDAAIEILRKKGQAVAAKRSDRDAAEGCVLAKVDGKFAAIIALKCETDFVAKNADFVALANAIIDAAVANRCQTLDEVKALPMGNGTIADAVVERSGVTGEKMELDGYCTIEGEQVIAYNHMNGNFLCALVALNKEVDPQVGKNIAMQVAAMSPVALNQQAVPQSVIDEEIKVAIEKTKQEQVQKAVEAALKKAGINPAHVDSEDHMESNMGKGWITAEDVARAKEIIATVSAEKAANLPEQMIQNIAKGRLNKFFKESCLMEQAYIDDSKISVTQYLESVEKGLTVSDFKRFTLRAE
ncbi:MAG: translation elongation factor Ts [Bacteroidaceae bacterium]|nr:elongation factor Ts [Candidatus Minthousia equi]MCQ2245717.1 translation elongation factor Ts [Bacteroidaceae bacterium]MDO4956393.1 translation elongation factor Ts [Bacteroidales bacterium]